MSAPALRFPRAEWKPETRPVVSNPLPTLALLWAIAGCWILWAVGYWSGRQAERGSQLGQVLALAPKQVELERALAQYREDSVLMARTRAPRRTRLPAAHPNTPKNVLLPVQLPTNVPLKVPPQPLDL